MRQIEEFWLFYQIKTPELPVKSIYWQKKYYILQKETALCVYHKAALIVRLIFREENKQNLFLKCGFIVCQYTQTT